VPDAFAPLHGLRVLDLTRAFPGGYCTLLLADLGADVLKLEAPGSGDPLRAAAGEGPAPAHVGLNRGKRSMTLDSRGAAGLEVLRRLVAGADVLVESARPGTMAAAGFGPEEGLRVNPALVWASITGFGVDGPYADRPGHDISFLGQSGFLAAMAGAGALPWMPEAMVSVPIGGLMAAFSVMAAVSGAQRTGVGSHVDASISDASTWMLSGMPGLLEPRRPNQAQGMGWSAGRRLYRCADGRFVTTAAAEVRTWRGLCAALGAHDLADQLWAGPDEQAAMAARFEAIFATRPAAEWVAVSAEATITVVNQGDDLRRDPQGALREALVEVSGLTVPATPVRLTAADGRRSATPAAGPPALGADTEGELAAVGYSPDEIAALRADGIV
jgi:crotonobetainyl-CoA:carnitine CoA-transferase CaiB-like acyl-CoA transferase